jgi:small subunit ribosomal protein S20
MEQEGMANHPSALKAHRQSIRRHDRNRRNSRSLRTALKSFPRLIADGKTQDAAGALPELYSKVDQAVRKGVLPKNAAARQKSRLTRRLNAAARGAAQAERRG